MATDGVIVYDTSGGAATVTLVTAVGNSGLYQRIVMKTAGNKLTINSTSAQTIGQFASGDLVMATVGDYIGVISDGTNWQIVEFQINTVAMYTTAVADTMTNNTATRVNFGTKVEDNLAAVTTGTTTWVYTAPFGGLYEVMGAVSVVMPAAGTAISFFEAIVFKNGVTERAVSAYNMTTGSGGFAIVPISYRARYAKNDTIAVDINQSSGANRTLSGSATENWVSVKRVGN